MRRVLLTVLIVVLLTGAPAQSDVWTARSGDASAGAPVGSIDASSDELFVVPRHSVRSNPVLSFDPQVDLRSEAASAEAMTSSSRRTWLVVGVVAAVVVVAVLVASNHGPKTIQGTSLSRPATAHALPHFTLPPQRNAERVSSVPQH